MSSNDTSIKGTTATRHQRPARADDTPALRTSRRGGLQGPMTDEVSLKREGFCSCPTLQTPTPLSMSDRFKKAAAGAPGWLSR